jgi:hypothetical protein
MVTGIMTKKPCSWGGALILKNRNGARNTICSVDTRCCPSKYRLTYSSSGYTVWIARTASGTNVPDYHPYDEASDGTDLLVSTILDSQGDIPFAKGKKRPVLP